MSTLVSCSITEQPLPDYLWPDSAYFTAKGYKLDSVGYKLADVFYSPYPYGSKPPKCDTCPVAVYSSYMKPRGLAAVERFEVHKRVDSRRGPPQLFLIFRLEYEINMNQVERVSGYRQKGDTTLTYNLDTVLTPRKRFENIRLLDSLLKNVPKGAYICGTAANEILSEGERSSEKLSAWQARQKIRKMLSR
jgi:hypothetical protein